MRLDKRINIIHTLMHNLAGKKGSMSFLRTSKHLPLNRAMQISPWFLVGSAVILALAISFWAVKNVSQERENMSRILLERAVALMWAMEGGARAGMGMQSGPYLQNMLEETAKQSDINYIAVVSGSGEILAHSDRSRIGNILKAPDTLAEISSGSGIHWRVLRSKDEGSIFQAFKTFAPAPGFREHLGHDNGHGMMQRRMARDWVFRGMRQKGARGRVPSGSDAPLPVFPPQSEWGSPSPGSEDTPQTPRQQGAQADIQAQRGGDFIIVVALNMAPFEKALNAGKRNILFTAFLVCLLGVGGFISLFWAQSYKLSRRLLLDASAIADKVVNSLPMGLIIVNAEGRVSDANAVAENLLEYPDKALPGLPTGDIRGLDWTAISRRVERGEPVLEEEHTLMLPGGGESGDNGALPVSVSAVKVLNNEGESLGLLFLLRDLREVKRLQKELRRSERLSTLGNMAARVAHEIRNPLSSIKGFATYLASRHNSGADAEAARTMIGEVNRLDRVVSELLDFARPSSLNIASEDVVAIAERAIRLVAMDADTKGVTVRLEPSAIKEGDKLRIAVDEERITQALLNLLINAVQATDRGGTVTLSPAPAKDNRIAIRITDTGCGMPEAVRVQIFNPYFTTKATGTGLGLAIVSKIVEDHLGEIVVQSAEGEGTVITLFLPAAEPAG